MVLHVVNLYCVYLSKFSIYTWADAVHICRKFWDNQYVSSFLFISQFNGKGNSPLPNQMSVTGITKAIIIISFALSFCFSLFFSHSDSSYLFISKSRSPSLHVGEIEKKIRQPTMAHWQTDNVKGLQPF